MRTGLADAWMVNKVQRSFVRWKETKNSREFASAYRELLAYRRTNESSGYANMSYLSGWEGRLWPTVFGLIGENAEEINPWTVRLAGETDENWREVSVRRHLTDEKGCRINTPAWYRAEFAISEGKRTDKCKLVFGAVDGDLMIWLNDALVLKGHPVSGSGAWKVPFPVDISKNVKPGRNRLLIYLDKRKRGPRGIHAPVFVECE